MKTRYVIGIFLFCTIAVVQCVESITKIHNEGVCALHGQCGSRGFVQLPCEANIPAKNPEDEMHRQMLEDTCGQDYAQGAICCDKSQLFNLIEQVKRAERIISSCPACWHNFLQFWCTFTCSPNQSVFVNVTSVEKGSNGNMVTSTDYWVGDNFGTQFYDSCKGIKFGSSNGFAMDFIGGGAKNWHEMVSYMGMERPMLGSPFQINFPDLHHTPSNGIQRYNQDGKTCSDSDPSYKCACVDCEPVCPTLPPAPSENPECYIGALRCWSFTMVICYGCVVILALFFVLSKNKRIAYLLEKYVGIDIERSRTLGLYERIALVDDEDDQDESLLDPDFTPRKYWLNTRLQSWFYHQGLFCARHPWVVITLTFGFVFLCSLGWSRFSIEQNPIMLWVSPSSQALAEKQHFDSTFSPFYRTTQLILVSEDGPISSAERLKNLFVLENEIREFQSTPNNYTLQDICFRPNEDACVVQSVTGYWQGDIDNFDPNSWESQLKECANQPVLCLPDFQQPLKPKMILGGYDDGDFASARAFIVTIVLRNSLDPAEVSKAEEWEQGLVSSILSTVNTRDEWKNTHISYTTESSLEKELNKSSNTDIRTVVISYLVMFLYASIALGRFTSLQPRRLLVDTKFSLGICGILIVLMSVSAAVGLFSFTGKKITLIIAEVIPFLVLAVGVDNIFILCHEYQRRQDADDEELVEIRIAKTLGKMGPSILLSSLSEAIAFGLGVLVTMPAVSSFAIVASFAILIDFLLQVTCFVSCLALDARRADNDRVDCVPCIQVQTDPAEKSPGLITSIINDVYAPAILGQKTRYVICLVFIGAFMFSLALIPQLPLGLDQRIALPSDSYLVTYFNDLDQYFDVGPPAYFVIRNANFTTREVQKKICGRFPACDDRSLANILEQERKRSEVSYISEPTSNWLDDFFYWLNPNVGCCRLKKSETLLDDRPALCGPWDDEEDCQDCLPDWSISMDTLPQGQKFMDDFDLWINMAPDEDCPLGGKSAYGDAVTPRKDGVGIEASHFRTFHKPLRTQQDFINAFASARRIATDLSEVSGLDVYPYSIFYVFFEQYSYIVTMAFELLGLAIVSIFIVTSALLGSLRSGVIVMTVVIMILVDTIGIMTLWNISLNAVSLVNLVICVGISVEFCCHIARSFMVTTGSLTERAAKSAVDVGSSVFCGITLTKFAGIIVLAFTRSKIFEVYYFRMYLTIVLLGALHGLMLLPVLLSLLGSESMHLLSDLDDNMIEWAAGDSSLRRGFLTDDEDNHEVMVTDLPDQS